jgi:hypothetical protein
MAPRVVSQYSRIDACLDTLSMQSCRMWKKGFHISGVTRMLCYVSDASATLCGWEADVEILGDGNEIVSTRHSLHIDYVYWLAFKWADDAMMELGDGPRGRIVRAKMVAPRGVFAARVIQRRLTKYQRMHIMQMIAPGRSNATNAASNDESTPDVVQ